MLTPFPSVLNVTLAPGGFALVHLSVWRLCSQLTDEELEANLTSELMEQLIRGRGRYTKGAGVFLTSFVAHRNHETLLQWKFNLPITC